MAVFWNCIIRIWSLHTYRKLTKFLECKQDSYFPNDDIECYIKKYLQINHPFEQYLQIDSSQTDQQNKYLKLSNTNYSTQYMQHYQTISYIWYVDYGAVDLCVPIQQVSIPSPPCSYVLSTAMMSSTTDILSSDLSWNLLTTHSKVLIAIFPFVPNIMTQRFMKNANQKSLLDIIFQEVLCSPSLDTRKTWAQRTIIYMIHNHLHYTRTPA